jgi:protein gp37
LEPQHRGDRISSGCDHCYALTLAKRLKAMGQPKYQTDGDPRTSGPGFGVALHPAVLLEPLRWRKPRVVFPSRIPDDAPLGSQAYAILTMYRGLYALRFGESYFKAATAAWAQQAFPQ